MKPTVRGPRVVDQSQPHSVLCPNCHLGVKVTTANEIATCSNCAVSWNWKRPGAIRGQR